MIYRRHQLNQPQRIIPHPQDEIPAFGIPQGYEAFTKSNKKHFDGFNRSQIQQLRLLKQNEKSILEASLVNRKLDAYDILGAETNTLISQAVKNRELARRMREERAMTEQSQAESPPMPAQRYRNRFNQRPNDYTLANPAAIKKKVMVANLIAEQSKYGPSQQRGWSVNHPTQNYHSSQPIKNPPVTQIVSNNKHSNNISGRAVEVVPVNSISAGDSLDVYTASNTVQEYKRQNLKTETPAPTPTVQTNKKITQETSPPPISIPDQRKYTQTIASPGSTNQAARFFQKQKAASTPQVDYTSIRRVNPTFLSYGSEFLLNSNNLILKSPQNQQYQNKNNLIQYGRNIFDK